MSASNGGVVSGAVSSEVEVLAKATRRRFSAEYKLKILRDADRLLPSGARSALDLGRWKPCSSGARKDCAHKCLGKIKYLVNLLACSSRFMVYNDPFFSFAPQAVHAGFSDRNPRHFRATTRPQRSACK